MLTLSGPGRTAAPYRLRACPFRLPDRFADYSRNTYLTSSPRATSRSGTGCFATAPDRGAPGPARSYTV